MFLSERVSRSEFAKEDSQVKIKSTAIQPNENKVVFESSFRLLENNGKGK